MVELLTSATPKCKPLGRAAYRTCMWLLLAGSGYCFMEAMQSGPLSTSEGAGSGDADGVIHSSLGLAIDAASLDLGRIPTHTRVRRTIRFTNESRSPVTIDSIVASCACTQVSPPSFTVPPRGTQDILLEVSANQSKGRGTEAFSGTLKLRSRETSAQFDLRAIAFDPVRPTTDSISFPSAVTLGSTAVSNIATLVVAREASVTAIAIPSDFGRVVNQHEVIDDDHKTVSFQVELEPVSGVSVVSAPVTVQLDVQDAEPATLNWNAVAMVESDIRFSPSSLIITAVGGEAGVAPAGLRVWSESGQPITDLTVSPNSMPIEFTSTESDSAAGTSLEFSLRPDAGPETQYGAVFVRGTSPALNQAFSIKVPTVIRRTQPTGPVTAQSTTAED